MVAKMQRLLEYLRSIPTGKVANADELALLLVDCWGEFDGAYAEGIEPYKLLGRMEDISWNPPILSFSIERHGRTVMGSTRAELQRWNIDLATLSATCGIGGHRQLKPMQPKLNVKPIAEEIVGLILRRQQDSRLKWNADGSVQIVIGNIIPADSAVQQTLAGRRRRVRLEVERGLTNHGWRQARRNVYAPGRS